MVAGLQSGNFHSHGPWLADAYLEQYTYVNPLNEGWVLRDAWNARDLININGGGAIALTSYTTGVSFIFGSHNVVVGSSFVQGGADGNLGGGNYSALQWNVSQMRVGIGTWSSAFIYKKLHVEGGQNSTGGWSIMTQWENDTTGVWTGLLFNVHSGNQGKGGIAMERRLTNGRGTIWICNSNVDNATEAALSDRVAGWLASGYNMFKAPNTAPVDVDIQPTFIVPYLDESGNNLKIRVKYADGTTLKTATIALT